MCYDEEVYPDPETFNPDRFLMSDGSSKSKLVLNPDVRDPSDIVFGFGRRICPGSDMARETMWIAIASVLAAFDIVPVKDANGKDLVPPFENEPGFIMYVMHTCASVAVVLTGSLQRCQAVQMCNPASFCDARGSHTGD